MAVRRVPRWVWQLGAYLAIGAGFVFTTGAIAGQAQQQCSDRLDGRAALRATVTEAFRPGTPTDFSSIPSFAELDPATQRFLNDLAALLSSAEGRTEVRDRILETIPPIDC